MDTHLSPIDRMDLSAALAAAVLIFVLLVISGVGLHAVLELESRKQHDTAVFRSLGMSAPALFPSGRPERAPELIDPRIDLRQTPTLSIPDPDPAKMVFTPR